MMNSRGRNGSQRDSWCAYRGFPEKQLMISDARVKEASRPSVEEDDSNTGAERQTTGWVRRAAQTLRGGTFRAIISFALLGLIFAAIDIPSALHLLKRTDYFYLGVALLFLSANKVAMASRWNVLTQAKGMTLSIRESLKISLIANFVGSFLPSGLGSDVYRIYYTSKKEKRADEVAASVIMERFIGMLTRSAVAVLGVILILNSQHQRSFGANLYAVILGFAALSMVAFWISIHDGTIKLLMRLIDWWGDSRVLLQGLKFQKAYVEYKRSAGGLLLVFVLSLVGVFLVSVGNYYVARALDINLGLLFYFGIVSIINIVNRIPVSIGGLGVTEGSYVLLFSTVGVTTTEAFTMALLIRVTECVFALAGWGLYVTAADAQRNLSPQVRADS
jgi:uncharacterized protein (TIRG00374 family)